MSNLEGLVRQLILILRYFAAPVVAAIIAWMFDDKHDVFDTVLVRDWTGVGATFSLWPLMVFLSVLGILVYFAHRTAFHPLVTRAMVWLATWRSDERPSVNDLAFERWRRRGAQDHTPERSSQAVLDEANAAGHFFYCSCWASLLLAASLKAIFPAEFALGKGVWGFTATVFVLFALGVVNDWQTTKLDLEAYRRYHGQ
jgi:hypothetical protein